MFVIHTNVFCMFLHIHTYTKKLHIFHLGFIEGDFWIQLYLSGQICLRADLRHTFPENEDISMPYVALYAYDMNLFGFSNKLLTTYEDELPIEPKDKQILDSSKARGYAIIELTHFRPLEPIEVRFSAAWHDPFEHFWIIKTADDNNI